jgi:hypothetical protein
MSGRIEGRLRVNAFLILTLHWIPFTSCCRVNTGRLAHPYAALPQHNRGQASPDRQPNLRNNGEAAPRRGDVASVR